MLASEAESCFRICCPTGCTRSRHRPCNDDASSPFGGHDLSVARNSMRDSRAIIEPNPAQRPLYGQAGAPRPSSDSESIPPSTRHGCGHADCTLSWAATPHCIEISVSWAENTWCTMHGRRPQEGQIWMTPLKAMTSSIEHVLPHRPPAEPSKLLDLERPMKVDKDGRRRMTTDAHQ